MSLGGALHALLAFVPAKVLVKDTRLVVVILGGRLEVREAKLPQKVSTVLNQVNGTILQPTVVLNHYIWSYPSWVNVLIPKGKVSNTY